MNRSAISDEFQVSEGVFRLVSYALVILMMACAALTLSALIQHFFPEWPSLLMGGLTVFIAFERLLTHAQFRKLTPLSLQWLTSLSAQWIIMLLVLRVAFWLSHSPGVFREELALLGRSLPAFFAAPDFLIAVIISIIVWLITGYLAELLDELGFEQAVILREVSAMDARYVPPRARLMSLVFTLGTILVFFTGLVRANIRELFLNAAGRGGVELDVLSSGGGSTLVYFMLGLALLSQTQFISLHTNWRLQEIPVSRGLARRWGPYSLLFLLILVATVSLLPTHYGLGMLTSLGYVVDVLVRILFFIAQVILMVALFLIGLPFMLFGAEAPTTEMPPPPVLPEPPLADAGTAAAFPYWALIRSILSWMLLLGILGFSLVHVLRRHGEFAERLRRLPGGRWLVQAWQWLQALFGGARRKMTEALEAGLARLRTQQLGEGISVPGGFLSLRRLNPRQRIYYFYLSLVRRGSERGLPRSPSQTPFEYASTLETVLPAVDEDIEALTGSFVEARYSRRAVPREEANLVQATWLRVRQALRNIKK